MVVDRLGLEPKLLLVSNRKEGGSFLEFDFEQQPVNIVVETDSTKTFECFDRESPDLLILDIDMDKAAVVDLISSLRPQMYIPILLLTSEGSDAFMLDVYNAGLDDFILKPVSRELLQAKVSVWLRRSWSAGPGILGQMKIGQMQ